MMSGAEIYAVNSAAARRSARAHRRPVPIALDVLERITRLDGLLAEGIVLPYIGERNIRYLTRLDGDDETLFVDKTGSDTHGPALSWEETVQAMRDLTREHGELYWGVVEEGQFQAYLGAWKPTARKTKTA